MSPDSLGQCVRRVHDALSVILDASSDAVQRQAAHNYCESLKKDEHAIDIAFHLLAPSNTLPIRNYALLLLDSQKSRPFGQRLWKSLGQLTSSNEHRLIHEKLAKIIADAALREWPEQWADYASCISSTITSQLTVQTLTRHVSVLYGEEDFIPAERKDKQKRVFEEHLLIPSIQYLAQNIPNAVQVPYMLDCFKSFASWAPFPPDHLIVIERQLLRFGEVDALTAICAASASKAEAPAHIIFLFSDDAFTLYNDFLGQTVNDPDRYEQLKAFVEWLCYLGTSFITKVTSGRETFVALMLALTRLPPLLVRSTICLFWLGLTRVEALLPMVPVHDFFLAVIEMESGESFRRALLNDADFEDQDEYRSVALATRSRFGDSFTHLASRTQAFQSLIGITSTFLAHSSTELSKDIASPTFVRQWTTLCYFIEAALRGHQKPKEAVELLRGFLQIPRPRDPELLMALIQVIRTATLHLPVEDMNLLETIFALLFDTMAIDVGSKDMYEYLNATSKAAASLVKFAEALSPKSITPLLPLIIERVRAHFSHPLCSSRRNDRRSLLELVLALAASQKDLTDLNMLRSMTESVRSELNNNIAALSTIHDYALSDASRAALSDTLSLLIIAEKRMTNDEGWELFARSVIERLSLQVFLEKKLVDWSESALTLAWGCLQAMPLMRQMIELFVGKYSPKLQSQLVKYFLRPLITDRGFDPLAVPIICSFVVPLLQSIPKLCASLNEDVEAARSICNLRVTLTSFCHDILCHDQLALEGSKKLDSRPDYILELLFVKKRHLPTSAFLPTLAPGELARHAIADKRLITTVLQSFLDSFAAMQSPSLAATVSTSATTKATQTLMQYLPALFTGELFPQAEALPFLYTRFLPLLLAAIHNPAAAEQQSHYVALLTEVIKWSWLLGLDAQLPAEVQSDALKERLLALDDLNYPSIKSQRKTVRRIVVDRDDTKVVTKPGAKSMLSKLKAYVEGGNMHGDEQASSAHPPSDIAITDLFGQ